MPKRRRRAKPAVPADNETKFAAHSTLRQFAADNRLPLSTVRRWAYRYPNFPDRAFSHAGQTMAHYYVTDELQDWLAWHKRTRQRRGKMRAGAVVPK